MELKLNHLSRRFKDKTAVTDFTAALSPGVWGLLGANGAGKTTLIRMIAGLLDPTDGEILYDGTPIYQLAENYRNVLGYLPQDFGYPPEFSVEEYLVYVAALKGLSKDRGKERIRELLEEVSLSEARRQKIRRLSGGMRRRVGIAQALLNDPRILILDEPTAGLDPGERVRFRKLLARLAQDRIVLISTHIVSDVEHLASRYLLMKEGRLAASGTAKELVKQMRGKVWTGSISPALLPGLENRLKITEFRKEEDGSLTLRYLAQAPELPGSRADAPRLEDVYLWLFPERTEYPEGDGTL